MTATVLTAIQTITTVLMLVVTVGAFALLCRLAAMTRRLEAKLSTKGSADKAKEV